MLLASRMLITLVLLALFVAVSYCQTSDDTSELSLGVQAYKEARYAEATRHFESAVAMNPQNVNAHLYLASTYAQEFIPGNEEAENVGKGQLAIHQYKEIIQLEPSNQYAVRGIAYLYLQMKDFKEAKTYYERASEIDPKDPEAYYSAAVIDWTMTYQPRMKIRARLKLAPEKALIGYPECSEVRAANEQLVADGIDKLNEAIQLRRDYDDAMAYMNLMYRERADIQCGNPQAYAADIRKADKWVDLTIAVKKAKTESRPPQQVVDESANDAPQ